MARPIPEALVLWGAGWGELGQHYGMGGAYYGLAPRFFCLPDAIYDQFITFRLVWICDS